MRVGPNHAPSLAQVDYPPAVRVLVVDDSDGVRELCRFVLAGRGHAVLEAASGADALTLYAQMKPDVVVLDVDMPGMDGLTTLEALRAIDSDARVVMLTGNRDAPMIRR